MLNTDFIIYPFFHFQSSATDMTNLSYWDDRVPDDCAKRPRQRASRFVCS